MQIRSEVMITVTAILIALAVPLLVYRKVSFEQLLTAQEKAVAGFSPATLTIDRKVWQDSRLTVPVTVPPTPPAQPAQPSAPGTAPAASGSGPLQPVATVSKPSVPKVSMILHDGSGGVRR